MTLDERWEGFGDIPPGLSPASGPPIGSAPSGALSAAPSCPDTIGVFGTGDRPGADGSGGSGVSDGSDGSGGSGGSGVSDGSSVSDGSGGSGFGSGGSGFGSGGSGADGSGADGLRYIPRLGAEDPEFEPPAIDYTTKSGYPADDPEFDDPGEADREGFLAGVAGGGPSGPDRAASAAVAARAQLPAARRSDWLARLLDEAVVADRQAAVLMGARARRIDDLRQASEQSAAAEQAEQDAAAPRTAGARIRRTARPGAGSGSGSASGRGSGPGSSGESGWSVANRAKAELATELAAVCTLTVGAARHLVEESRTLVHNLPATLNALEEGRIRYEHAKAMADACWSLPVQARAAFEEALLPHAGLPVPAFRIRVVAARERLHPEPMAARHEKAAQYRGLTVEHGQDGMGWLTLHDSSETVAAIYNRITDIALPADKDDPRTLAQRRADAAAAILLKGDLCSAEMDTGAYTDSGTDAGDDAEDDAATGEGIKTGEGAAEHAEHAEHAAAGDGPATPGPRPAAGPRQAAGQGQEARPGQPARQGQAAGPPLGRDGRRLGHGIHAQVHVEVPVLTLLGRDDTPATLDGVIPIDPATARELVGDANGLYRLLTDPVTGSVVSFDDRFRYLPPSLRRAVHLIDGGCTAPWCSNATGRTDGHHPEPWAVSRDTSLHNSALLCPPDHRTAHNTRWTMRRLPNGDKEWISPLGHATRVPPRRRLAPGFVEKHHNQPPPLKPDKHTKPAPRLGPYDPNPTPFIGPMPF